MKIEHHRIIYPFFEKAINRVFTESDKSMFVVDGAIGTGKTSEFTVRGAYTISCLVPPIRKGNFNIRESKWAMIRQSENSAYNTIIDILEYGIFSPEIISSDRNIITVKGSYPKEVLVRHSLTDGTILEMKIECHGFNNDDSFERLKTHQFLGAMVPEAQSIPWIVMKTVAERCGRWNSENIIIKKEIDGKQYILSGVSKLKIVLIDINIPARPHYLYDEWYDRNDKDLTPFSFITPPKPIKYIPEQKASDDIKGKYPTSMYNGERVVWVPNPDAYNFTRHFEEVDENGNKMPWTGFKYWLDEVYRSDSEVTRYILGEPEKKGGAAAIYKKFERNNSTIRELVPDMSKPFHVGYDPGGNSAIVILQFIGGIIKVYKEICFFLEDNVSTREMLEDFFVPWVQKNINGSDIIVVPDPASMWLGKSKMSGSTESVNNIMNDVFKNTNAARFKIVPCRVQNQDVNTRVESLGLFISQNNIEITPSCEYLIDGLCGGYHYKQVRGTITDTIDKADNTTHVVEALQYPVVNIVHTMRKKSERKTNKARIGTIKRKRNYRRAI